RFHRPSSSCVSFGFRSEITRTGEVMMIDFKVADLRREKLVSLQHPLEMLLTDLLDGWGVVVEGIAPPLQGDPGAPLQGFLAIEEDTNVRAMSMFVDGHVNR